MRELLSREELREILEYYKAGYHNEYANKDIERLVEEIYHYQEVVKQITDSHPAPPGYAIGSPPKKVKKVKKV